MWYCHKITAIAVQNSHKAQWARNAILWPKLEGRLRKLSEIEFIQTIYTKNFCSSNENDSNDLYFPQSFTGVWPPKGFGLALARQLTGWRPPRDASLAKLHRHNNSAPRRKRRSYTFAAFLHGRKLHSKLLFSASQNVIKFYI